VLDRVFARVAQQEAAIDGARQRAQVLMDELMQHPPARQRLLVDNSSRFRDPMLCENLLSTSHELGFQDPARSQHLARLAVDIAERGAAAAGEIAAADEAIAADANPQASVACVVPGLRARAWAQLGNAMRIAADLDGASEALARAEDLLAGDPPVGLLDQARVLDLKASLCKDRRELPQAIRLLDRVIAIYRRLGQASLLGHALGQKAVVLQEAGDIRSSMALLRRALDLLDPNEEPRRFLAARHNLICALLADGRPREAFALLFHTRPLYLKMGDRMNLVRLRWVEGQIAHALNRPEQAEAAHREVRQAFVEMGAAYDAALVSLDLAALYAQQGRAAEMRGLAREMLTFFESRQIHREAMAALLIFCEAARMERAGLGLVQEVAAFLKKARNSPDLRFTSSH
jgi:tetratricopeptide (TPR) repeat protein